MREGGRSTDTHRASRARTDDDTVRDGANMGGEGRGRWGSLSEGRVSGCVCVCACMFVKR